MTIAAWLALLVGPLARRVVVALGFGLVTYVGLDAALAAALDAARASSNGLAALPAALIAIAGFNTAFGIIAGALSARLAFVQLKRLVPQ